MRIRRWMYGALALVACLGLGAALGLWIYSLSGQHFYVAPRSIMLISALVGPLCACIGAFSLVMLATGARANADTSARPTVKVRSRA